MNSAEKTAALLKLLGQAPYVHGVTELGEDRVQQKRHL